MTYRLLNRLILAVLICVASFCTVLARQPLTKGAGVDWAKVEMEVSNSISPYYYPSLMERYAVGDTSLTFDDYYHLYYGFPSQPAYKPLMPNTTSDSLLNLFSRRTSPTYDTYEKAAILATDILAREPFNLRDINVLAYVLNKLGRSEAAAREMRKITMLDKVIRSTGSGLTKESPWFIIHLSHADDMVALMNLNLAKTIVVDAEVEFLQVQFMPDELRQYKGFYFNFAEVYRRRPDYLDNVPKPKRRMEINNTRPWEIKRN